MREPNFENLLKVLRRERPDRPTLFEFFLNEPLYQELANGDVVLKEDGLDSHRVKIHAFKNAGYDYATIPYPEETRFPTERSKRRKSTFQDEKEHTISLNDGAMIGILEFLRDVGESNDFDFVDSERRARAGRAVKKGIDCILRCQIVVNGERTAWCAQHDEVSLVPQKARSYEHPSISGGESAGICLFLMSIEDPSPRVIDAVSAACRWYEKSQIRGIRVERKDGDKVVVTDSDAPPIWARFYEIGTNRPIFSGRDGVIKYKLSEIEHERRNGYSWYVSSGRKVLDAWPGWIARQSGSE